MARFICGSLAVPYSRLTPHLDIMDDNKHENKCLITGPPVQNQASTGPAAGEGERGNGELGGGRLGGFS